MGKHIIIKECSCGVIAVENERLVKSGRVDIKEFYESECFVECIGCPNDMLAHDFYRSVGVTFRNICEKIADYLEESLPVVDIGRLDYAFLVSEDGSIRGACGYEDSASTNNKNFKLYINPLSVDINDNTLKIFTRLLSIAIHEMSHIALHVVDSTKYHLQKNFHCPEFFEIYAFIDEYFYDRENFMKIVWA